MDFLGPFDNPHLLLDQIRDANCNIFNLNSYSRQPFKIPIFIFYEIALILLSLMTTFFRFKKHKTEWSIDLCITCSLPDHKPNIFKNCHFVGESECPKELAHGKTPSKILSPTGIHDLISTIPHLVWWAAFISKFSISWEIVKIVFINRNT